MDILDIVSKFQIKERVVGYSPLGNGHINSTFLINTDTGKRYVLQKINSYAFKNVDQLMENMYKTTSFLIEHGFETLKVVKTKDDGLYVRDGEDYYRLTDFIENTICYEGVENLNAVYNAGKAFGLLHRAFRDYDASTLYEVIPNFHNTKKRYQDLLDAIKVDPVNRFKTCQIEYLTIHNRERDFSYIVDSIASGDIQLAVTHNDPKINNVLFDKDSGAIRAVIDLDTIMPGSYLYDFGDALRSLFTGEYEDSRDVSKVGVDYQIFESYTKGYLSEMKDVLNQKEIEALAFSVFLLTIEVAIRFLTDYINGDVYFHIDYPEHNLVRARTQIKLAEDIYKAIPELNEIVKKCLK